MPVRSYKRKLRSSAWNETGDARKQRRNADVADLYYRESGKIPPHGGIILFACGTAAAALVGIIYAAINFYNPLIYVTLIATCVYGVAVGVAVGFGVTLSKVRNRYFTIAVGAVCGLIAVYFAWVYYVWLKSDREFFVWSPGDLFSLAKLFSQTGLWSIRSFTPTGALLWIIWLIEAGIILVLCLGVTLIVGETPFCEACNRWTKEHTSPAKFCMTDYLELKEDLEAGDYDKLDALYYGDPIPGNFLQVKVHKCPGCKDSTYLSVDHIVHRVDGEGEKTTDETSAVKHLRISHKFAKHLLSLPGK